MTRSWTLGILDIGSSKIGALVVEVRPGWPARVLGFGVAPSQGLQKGVVVDMPALTRSVTRAMLRALRMARLKPARLPVWANVAVAPIKAFNNTGAAGVTQGVVDEKDVLRAEEAAQAVPLEHNQLLLHVIRRGYRLDDKEVKWPVGMYGYRLEAEVHLITVPKTEVYNLQQCIEDAGFTVEGFVLSGLAAGEAVLSEGEREMGVVVCDIGAGTTDVAVYVDGEVCHTDVIPIAGHNLTRDLSVVLSIPFHEAESLKRDHGFASPNVVPRDADWVTFRPFGEGDPVRLHPRHVAEILEARLRQIFDRVRETLKTSGKADALPAGLVLTGGTARLPGLRQMAMEYLKMPVRIARPEGRAHWPQQMGGPEFTTLLGVLQFVEAYASEQAAPAPAVEATWGQRLLTFLRGLLPLMWFAWPTITAFGSRFFSMGGGVL